MVRPSPIGVDADELTYNFHIALRYDIEKKLIEGKLSVSDLPALWNNTMQNYLGVRPRKLLTKSTRMKSIEPSLC